MRRFLSSSWARHHEHTLIAVGIGVVAFALQFLLLPFFGVSWDEPLHRNWAELSFAALQNWNPEITSLMPGFGMFYGPLFYMVNTLLSVLFLDFGFPFYETNHVGIIFASSIGLSFCYLLGERVDHRRVGLLAVFFCIFYLPFIAHAQYNPKDIPLCASIVATAYFFLRGLQQRSPRFFFIAAALFGLSFSLKIVAVLMIPVFMITYAIVTLRVFITRSRTVDRLLLPILCACVAVVTILLTWPTAWLQPSLPLSSLIFFTGSGFWHGTVLYFGTLYSGIDLPWHFVLFEYFSTMPVLMIACFFIGLLRIFFSFLQYEHRSDYLLLTLWIFFPLLFASNPAMIRYDGMRQYFFVLPAIAIVAALGFDALFLYARRWHWRKMSLSSLLLCIVALSFTIESYTMFPYFGSYRNEIIRLMYPTHMEKYLEVEYFGSTLKDGVAWLNMHAKQNAVVCVPTAGFLMEWYETRSDLTFECTDRSTYVMVFLRNRSFEMTKGDSLEPVYRISRMGADLLKIYEV